MASTSAFRLEIERLLLIMLFEYLVDEWLYESTLNPNPSLNQNETFHKLAGIQL
jgi:hypothetical protein